MGWWWCSATTTTPTTTTTTATTTATATTGYRVQVGSHRKVRWDTLRVKRPQISYVCALYVHFLLKRAYIPSHMIPAESSVTA